jgi:hypothetical protein
MPTIKISLLRQLWFVLLLSFWGTLLLHHNLSIRATTSLKLHQQLSVPQQMMLRALPDVATVESIALIVLCFLNAISVAQL